MRRVGSDWKGRIEQSWHNDQMVNRNLIITLHNGFWIIENKVRKNAC